MAETAEAAEKSVHIGDLRPHSWLPNVLCNQATFLLLLDPEG